MLRDHAAPVEVPMSRTPVPSILLILALMAPLDARAAPQPEAGPVVSQVQAPVVVPFVLDGGRPYVEVTFELPDGSRRKALAWANFGTGGMQLSPAIRAAYGDKAPIRFSLGGVPVRVDQKALLPASPEELAQLGPLPVEAVLPASLWPNYRLTLDYASRTFTLAPPSDGPAPGAPVPIRVNPRTGLASVHARIDGHDYALVIDNGYTWMRGPDVRGWLKRHPDWYRADGALGQSNQAMVGEALEQQGTVVRVESMTLGGLELHDVGVLGGGEGNLGDRAKYALFWKIWGAGAAEPVAGWIGPNLLQSYRITIDYQHHMSYWLKVGAPQTGELTSSPLSLIHGTKNYFIGGLVSRHGRTAVTGIAVGDKLLTIDGRDVRPMSRGTIEAALAGRPGEVHRLTLERNGQPVSAAVKVEPEVVP
jgi:hypothetical protein